MLVLRLLRLLFLSTPSARRATRSSVVFAHKALISIHALREEGDRSPAGYNGTGKDFYPRPPRGGRHGSALLFTTLSRFLSTPSARRATCASS